MPEYLLAAARLVPPIFSHPVGNNLNICAKNTETNTQISERNSIINFLTSYLFYVEILTIKSY
jgi:hypothetical protein